MLQSINDLVVGQLADVFRDDRIDELRRVLLQLQSTLQAGADAGDNNGFN